MRAAAGGTAGEEQIMTAIKGTHAASHQRTSSQNGLPEPVPYVYGQQTRRNTYAARIAQRNAQGWWQLPAALPEPKLTGPLATAATTAQILIATRAELHGADLERFRSERARLLRTGRTDDNDDGNVDHPKGP
jgi:hypothetical protein